MQTLNHANTEPCGKQAGNIKKDTLLTNVYPPFSSYCNPEEPILLFLKCSDIKKEYFISQVLTTLVT